MSDRGITGNESVQRELAKDDKRLRDFELSDLEAVLRTAEGRRLYYQIIYTSCELEMLPVDLAIKDGICSSLHTYYRCGRQSVGQSLTINAKVNFPALWALTLKEHDDRAAKDADYRNKAIKAGKEMSND
jgi:hypothetical protein